MHILEYVSERHNIISSIINNSPFVNTITIVSGIVGVCGALIGIVRLIYNKNRKIHNLEQKVEKLSKQNNVIKEVVFKDQNDVSKKAYISLNDVGNKVLKAVNAEIFSISIALPFNKPTHLKIIISSDPNHSKVIGKEFPIDVGIAGWTYKNQRPHYVNKFCNDPRYFNKIDKAAGTDYGKGAVLTIPLIHRENCIGVAQFFKPQNQSFCEQDISISSNWIKEMSELLSDIEESPNQSSTSITYNSTIQAVIMFCDICSFSEVVNKISLQTSVDLINEYYNRLTQIALNNGAKLEEYVGDGLYLSFSDKDNLSSMNFAIIAALQMQKEFNSIIDSWVKYDHPVSSKNKHAIGMAFGEVYKGPVGHENIRKEKLVGRTINLAAHLCKSAKEFDSGILICSNIADVLKNNTEYKLKLVELEYGEFFQVTE